MRYDKYPRPGNTGSGTPPARHLKHVGKPGTGGNSTARRMTPLPGSRQVEDRRPPGKGLPSLADGPAYRIPGRIIRGLFLPFKGLCIH
ncbi:hypothetical protein ED312_14430 [Sinomicrobium pectinilyticum]|uniref:Uncharacterized protein n=1 Tax=Sinomicrobium pectinilyticum TaxID=1084421 RepID=A0A3N0E812_SINP1|nr:hypothetical protein ED312_14430 [Sinomicrobium pectinilyticum]